MDQELIEEDSVLHGFHADGAPALSPRRHRSTQQRPVRTRRAYKDAGWTLSPPAPIEAARQGGRPRANTDPLARVPEGEILVPQASFEWDNFEDEIVNEERRHHNSTSNWSSATQFHVPVDTTSDTGSSDEDGFESPDGGTSAEDGTVTQPSEESDRGEDDMDAAGWIRIVRKSILEADEDILPFTGRRTTLECLTTLIGLAAGLKRELQRAHLELGEDPTYVPVLRDLATTCRAGLTGFILEAETIKAEMQTQVAEQQGAARAEAAAHGSASAAARRPLVARRVRNVGTELQAVLNTFERLTLVAPGSDEELFERVEKIKTLENQHTTAAAEGKEVAKLAMDHDLMTESGEIDELLGAARAARVAANEHVLVWRKSASVWSGDKRRAGRSDLKMPTYVAGMNAKMTVYEFEKEWAEYSRTMDYSKEEAVKVLKQAVQPPARADILNLTAVERIFEYLKKHHGNPMMLLHAKEQEVRGWSLCKGTDMQQREWLVNAKSKLESITTMCVDHKIDKYLHFSTVAGDIQSKLPPDLTKDFKKILKAHLSPSGVLEKEIILGLLADFIEDKILDCTLGVNLDIVNYLGANMSDKQVYDAGGSQTVATTNNGKQRYTQQKSGMHTANQQQGGGSFKKQPGGGGPAGSSGNSYQVDDTCLTCGGHHTHLFYCEAFINADLQARFDLVKKQQSCGRCLGMKVKLTGRRDDWHPMHEKYCKTKFACKEDRCAGRLEKSQYHITLCKHHSAANKAREADFISSLNQSMLPASCQQHGVQFLHMGVWLPMQPSNIVDIQERSVTVGGEVFEVVPDVAEAAVFMMQTLPAAKADQPLLAFYDSGCGSAGISDRAFHLLNTTTVRKGPTVLDVAGGKCVEIPYGDERFTLQLNGGKQLATITALRMPQITSLFPLVQLKEAWDDLATAAGKKQLPSIDTAVGGSAVDVILGIKYLKYFPEFVFSLPSGLAIYRARFKSYSGHQAILGGPHAAWSAAALAAGHMNPRAYLTSEARAWCVQESWVRLNQDRFKELEEEVSPSCCLDEESSRHSTILTVKKEEREFWRTEAVGADSPYRCESCRGCQKCKRADELEEISFKEEAEQALIEASVVLDSANSRLVASLPFIENPATALKPNRHVANSILKSQLVLFNKRPDMREDTVKSHDKLVSRGFVKPETELTKQEQEAVTATPGDGYFIPWRIVHNEGSLSTPCRMVFDASSKTPGGNSLNGVLAKGKNRLVKLQHLLARFRQRAAAVTADISMAYNGTWLQAGHIKYQKYLWKEQLDENNPTVVMHVLTLIYGVKPSGGQCQVSIEKLAAHFKERHQHVEAAEVLEKDVYVDDIISSCNSREECRNVATGIMEILQAGGLHVKAFTFSGEEPVAAVSADGVHVGLAGYLWRPKEDVLLLDIGPPRLGKAKRGKMPEPVVGDFGAALKKVFTRRTLAGLVARVFDPLGLATPLTAGLKLDLHSLCEKRLDWDDPVPAELLATWADNMAAIQDLKEVIFKRTIIPADAVMCKVDLLVAVDASQHLAAAAIYGRVLRKCGAYSCQLIMARSKITTSLTIPRAELRSAVIGAVSSQVIKRNLGECLGEVVYVTDSTVCLHWINQDDRPLQVAVRNAVIEIRRFSDVHDWMHVDGHDNIADLATRKASVADIKHGSAWQEGREWMKLARAEMPLKTATEVILSAEEKRAAAEETRARDVYGHSIMLVVDQMAARYSLSRYLIDPCRFSWSKVLRVLAFVIRFTRILSQRVRAAKVARQSGPTGPCDIPEPEVEVIPGRSENILPDELSEARDYFFKKTTGEVKQFSKPKEYKNCSVEKGGVLYFSGRILDGQEATSLESVMFDLNPLCFCQPIVDRYSPVAYSIMIETHWSNVNHLNAACAFRESLSQAYILGGRDLSQEVRKTCVFCKRFKAKLLEVEMGKIHETRLSIAPPFTICQVDLFGPYKAQCEHNHRSTVKVWGAVFKDPASGAIFVHAMSKCDTSAFIQAYTRFSARFCHPQKLYPDLGSQLIQACREMEISWIDVAHTLNAEHGVGVEFHPCPVGGHNVHGVVERSIQEVKKLFDTVYHNVKLDILGFETAFGWISNELNNLPLCLGSRYRDLDHLDLLTPNRLIHGRANKRALSGCCMIGAPSAMLARMEDVFEAWWKAWYQEKIADFVAKPVKWLKSDRPLKEGDIVLFLKTGDEQVLGETIWRIGRVKEVEQSEVDLQVRTVVLEYKNLKETVFRTTRRSVRKVAVLHREEELELVQELNAAARAAERLADGQFNYLEQQMAVSRDVLRCEDCNEPWMCAKHDGYFMSKPFVPVLRNCQAAVESPALDCVDVVCAKLAIHVDPW